MRLRVFLRKNGVNDWNCLENSLNMEVEDLGSYCEFWVEHGANKSM